MWKPGFGAYKKVYEEENQVQMLSKELKIVYFWKINHSGTNYGKWFMNEKRIKIG